MKNMQISTKPKQKLMNWRIWALITLAVLICVPELGKQAWTGFMLAIWLITEFMRTWIMPYIFHGLAVIVILTLFSRLADIQEQLEQIKEQNKRLIR